MKHNNKKYTVNPPHNLREKLVYLTYLIHIASLEIKTILIFGFIITLLIKSMF